MTPEITRIPQQMGTFAARIRAKAGGLADVSASLVEQLCARGFDVHVALPNFRRLFKVDVSALPGMDFRHYKTKLPTDRIHLAEDCAFYRRERVYQPHDDLHLALTFQREVINHVIPRVQPDLIHCHDWMTGLIPPLAKKLAIPTLFTLHNIHTSTISLGDLEQRGIDPVEFWDCLYYENPPGDLPGAYNNPVDLLASGIFAADTINVVSPTFLGEIASGQHDVPASVRTEIRAKYAAGYAHGIVNAPDQSYSPSTDRHLVQRYGADDFAAAKAANKRAFQRTLGLTENPSAPLFFWPSRLDPVQKGCHLLTDILYQTVSDYWPDDLQVAVVADGPHQQHFHDIANQHRLTHRIAVCNFDDALAHLGYAASDFLLMPSLFEPCGLPQMIGCLYGCLPVVHDTGGLHDTVDHLDPTRDAGNGFVFQDPDPQGLRWAIDQAMEFYRLPDPVRKNQIARVMRHARTTFDYRANAEAYIDLYQRILARWAA